MTNYSIDWKKYVSFKEMKYDDFISLIAQRITDAECLQKVDGALGAMIYERGSKCKFQTTGNQFLENLPVLEEYQNILDNIKSINSVVLMGEMVAKRSGSILPFNQTISIVKTPTKGNNATLIHHYLYDLFYINGHKITDYKTALKFIDDNFNIKTKFIHIPSHVKWQIDRFSKLYHNTIMTPGFDGVVVRQFHGRNYKIKPFQTFDLAVIGAGNEFMPAWAKKQISYLIVAFIDKDGNFRLSSKVGTGYDFKTRSMFYDYIMKEKILEKNGEFFVQPRMIIEVEFLRYDVRDMPCYKFDGKTFHLIGKKASGTMINPRFSKIREDKKMNEYDVRLGQIPEFDR